jgi:hypothetical protein
MTKTIKLSLFLAVLLSMASMSFGQTILTHTTLSAAVTTTSQTVIPLTSAAGVTATNSILFIADGLIGEAVFVNAVNGTNISVTRGYQSLGKARPHLSGALVFVVPLNTGYPGALNTVAPTGSCTRTSVPYLPIISVGLGGAPTLISDCVGGVWVAGNLAAQNNSPFRVLAPNPGAVALSTINTAGTTLAATTMYCNEIDLPASKLATGLGVLNGSTATTDNHLVVLYDATGNLVTNSATAGVLAATPSVYQGISFTTSYYLVGPAVYFGCLQTNGTTATVRMEVTGVNDTYLTKGVTGQTFGTIPATITVPTTFTTAVGPYLTVF